MAAPWWDSAKKGQADPTYQSRSIKWKGQTYVPHDIGRAITREDLGETATIVLLMQQGVVIGRVDQRIRSVPAPKWIADLLGVEPGAPLLRAILSVFELNGRGVEYVISHFRGDTFEYRAVMIRGGAGTLPLPS